MTTTTLGKDRIGAEAEVADAKPVPATSPQKAEAKKEKAERARNEPSRLRTALARLSPTTSEGLPMALWVVSFRSIVLIGFHLLAVVTAQGLIPALGLWLHQESGAAQGQLTFDGTIAMWLMPLLFLVALIVAGELAVMRAMWRWSSRMLQQIRDARTEASDEPVTTATAPRTTRQSKINRKRSN